MATPATAAVGPTSETNIAEEQTAHGPCQKCTFSHKDGRGMRIAIVSTRWHAEGILHPLVEAMKKELFDRGVDRKDITQIEVPGAFELPFAAGRVIQVKKDQVDAVIALGCMIKGATMAYEFVSEAVTMGLMKLNVKTETPVVYGLLTCTDEGQAKACAASTGTCGTGDKKCNHGIELAQSAIEMAHLKRCITGKIGEKKQCGCNCHCETKDCKCSCHCSNCECKTCTCKGDCKCTSCGGKEASKCTSCNQQSGKCGCSNCQCASCEAKLPQKKQ